MSPYARLGTASEVSLQALGEAIVRCAFRDAAKVFLHAVTQAYEAAQIQEAVLFIQGSGLEVTITRFGLPLDAHDLRGTFQWKLHKLASSSHITLDGRCSNGA